MGLALRPECPLDNWHNLHIGILPTVLIVGFNGTRCIGVAVSVGPLSPTTSVRASIRFLCTMSVL